MKNANEKPCIEDFNAVEWNQYVKREFAKKWSDENVNPGLEKLQQILSQDRDSNFSASQ